MRRMEQGLKEKKYRTRGWKERNEERKETGKGMGTGEHCHQGPACAAPRVDPPLPPVIESPPRSPSLPPPPHLGGHRDNIHHYIQTMTPYRGGSGSRLLLGGGRVAPSPPLPIVVMPSEINCLPEASKFLVSS
ncbi:hypothetical protein E2C01_019601 [Portunus trituberculatus]|uniref:Uncharacterized protein n=1 Tax=Portunus trituberculatus TaxID=210409 RepID=A0A5B7DXN4_PORTR|nr:hypothetical protein [Portunus trituberculatus]